jgi:AbrB family looped-hinge helix DNA binding protein
MVVFYGSAQMDREHQEAYRSKVDSAGRIVIPAGVRERLGIAPGEELIIREDGEGIRVETFRQALKRAQAFFTRLKKPGESVVDELLRERREEAARE